MRAPLLPHLAACVTFFYVPERLCYLAKLIANYIELAAEAEVYIITNVGDDETKARILASLPPCPAHVTLRLVTPSGLGHPYLLTWTHREIFRQALRSPRVTHFLYSEDDLDFTASNVRYWLKYRQPLRSHGLIPSFFRVEQHPARGWYSTDCTSPVDLERQPGVLLPDGIRFICMPIPYQGLYFLDRELMEEFAASPAMSPDFGKWRIREKATAGLTFVNIPAGFTSRNVVPVCLRTRTVPEECWVHHLPNNYVNDERELLGKLPMQGLFREPRKQRYGRLGKIIRRLWGHPWRP